MPRIKMARSIRKTTNRLKNTSLFFKCTVIFLLMSAVGVVIMGFMRSGGDAESVASILEIAAEDNDEEMRAVVEQDVIYENIYVNSVSLGGLSKEQAMDKLAQKFQSELDKQEITFRYGENDESSENSKMFTFADFDAKLDFSKAVDDAYAYGRDGSLQERYDKIMELNTKPLRITYEPAYSYNSMRIQELLEPIKESVYIAAVDATITRANGAFSTTEGSSGRQLDAEKAAADIEALLKEKKEGTVEGVVEAVAPRFMSADFDQAKTLLGSFSTTFTPGDNGRNTNVKTASSKINDTVVYPGEVFSTNAAFGAMTYDNGYREAPVIVAGVLEDGFGGGVCQVSSTLYNALLYAELAIVERQNHSLKVGYTDYGFDATLAGDYIDLKFSNNTDLPIFIESYISGGNKVTVNIYGKEIHSSSRRLEFINELVEKVEPGPEKIVEDDSLPLDERLVVHASKNGYRYNVFKIVYENGVEIDRVKINTSYYKPTAGEVRVGTGKAVVDPVETEIAEGETQNTVDGAADVAQPGNSSDAVDTSLPQLEQPVYMPEQEQSDPIYDDSVLNGELPVIPE